MAAPARTVWSAFNRWRKRHWPLRVIILCLFLVHALVDGWPMSFAVNTACKAILAESEPAMTDAIYHSNKANAARRLRNALVAKLDKDEDGVFNDSEGERAVALGLDPDQLFAKPFRYDLSEIVAAAQRADLVPPSYTARAIRKEAWRAAQAESEEIMAPEREKIESFITWYRVADYLDWRTWERAFGLLLSEAYYPWWKLGDPVHLVPGLLAVFLAPAVAAQFVRRKYVALGALAFWLVLAVVTIDRHVYWAFSSPYSVCLLGQLLLVGALLLSGVRSATRQARNPAAVRSLLVVFGATLICWGLGPALRNAVHKPEIGTWQLLSIYFSSVTRVVLVVLGGVAICASAALAMSNRLARALGVMQQARH